MSSYKTTKKATGKEASMYIKPQGGGGLGLAELKFTVPSKLEKIVYGP